MLKEWAVLSMPKQIVPDMTENYPKGLNFFPPIVKQGFLMSSVTGIFSNNRGFIRGQHVAHSLYDFNFLEDGRGQAASGAAIINEMGDLKVHTGKGPSKIALPFEMLSLMSDHTVSAGISHNCYAKKRELHEEDVQPIVIETEKHVVSVSSDGIVLDKEKMRQELMDKGYRFKSCTNGEFIGMLFTNYLENDAEDEWEAGKKVLDFVNGRGGFSATMLVKNKGTDKTKLVALRDEKEVKPLYCGEKDNTLFVNSETYPFSLYGIDFERVNGGEMVVASENGFEKRPLKEGSIKMPCIFEIIYYGSPSSFVLEPLGPRFQELVKKLGVDTTTDFIPEISMVRSCLGLTLSEYYKDLDIDVLFDVPDSGKGVTFGLGVGYDLKAHQILTGQALPKSSAYRTFQWANRRQRAREVFLKLHVIANYLRRKIAMGGDDSIVYGGMSGAGRDIELPYDDMYNKVGLVGLLKYLADVAHFYFAISYAPMPFQCFFEFDKPQKKMAAEGMFTWDLDRINKEVAEKLEYNVGGKDGDKRLAVCYQPRQNIYDVCGNGFCTACMDGRYPVEDKYIPPRIMEFVKEARKAVA